MKGALYGIKMDFITRLVQLDVLFPYMRPKASIDLLRLLPGSHTESEFSCHCPVPAF